MSTDIADDNYIIEIIDTLLNISNSDINKIEVLKKYFYPFNSSTMFEFIPLRESEMIFKI